MASNLQVLGAAAPAVTGSSPSLPRLCMLPPAPGSPTASSSAISLLEPCFWLAEGGIDEQFVCFSPFKRTSLQLIILLKDGGR